MFKALRKRQEVKFRHDCFAVAIAAADYRNAHRAATSDRLWSPLDYVTCEENSNPHREEAKRNIASAYAMASMLRPLTAEEAAAWRLKIVRDLLKQGFEDAEQLIDESFTKD